VTAVIIHCIVRNKVVEEWSEGSDVAELVQHRLEQEMRDRIEQGLRVARRIQQASLSKEVPELEGWQTVPTTSQLRKWEATSATSWSYPTDT
jgi:hypothetical protein